ncbi:MAG: DivIVA domain-containing protein [Vulcanibacillus sp.]
MNPEYFEEIIKNKRFDRSLQGYNPKQVDRYLQKMTNYYFKVSNEKEELENKVKEYEKQEINMRNIFVKVEETTEEIKKKALDEAEIIIIKAKEEAEVIRNKSIKNAETIKTQATSEGEKHIQNLIQNCMIYEDQTKKLIGTLYFKVRRRISGLQEDLTVELNEYVKILESTINSTHHTKKTFNEISNQNNSIDRWKQKEEELLIGYKIRENIRNNSGKIVVPKETVITPETIKLLIKEGVYGEVFTVIDSEADEYVK